MKINKKRLIFAAVILFCIIIGSCIIRSLDDSGIGEETGGYTDTTDTASSAISTTQSCDSDTESDGPESDTSAESGDQESDTSNTEPETEPVITSDPYVNVSKTDFYNNYKPASCYLDSYYRTKHGLMSGSIDEQDQDPTVSEYRPEKNGCLIRHNVAFYEDNGNTYVVIDAMGNEAFKVYKGGAYVTLEEVAAYLFAFGDVPANYVENKYESPSNNKWGKYLRLNHSYFSGNSKKYPYEPDLPEISGLGGELDYYEIDIGTTGTDCDPSYVAKPYNTGTKITRGAARIVYTRYDRNGDEIIDINEKYLFYTNNHYNDFYEYLNYEGGWGEIFGNITGGGKLSDKYDCNPTPYIKTILDDIREYASDSAAYIIEIEYVYIPGKDAFDTLAA